MKILNHLQPTLYLMSLAALCYSCSSSGVFKPYASANPWPDDYSALTSMEHKSEWGTYNVHDPSCRKVGDTYYMYSTDAILMPPPPARPEGERPEGERPDSLKRPKPFEMPGYIQVRKSTDLVHWSFVGWAFPQIPEAAKEWVQNQNDGRGAYNIWAPYMIPYGDKFRLYYCVSAFGKNTSYIGLAESTSPEGPWTQIGCVVKTATQDAMNAIDPSILADPKTGRWWMHYGSYFGGLYCVELDPVTGLTLNADDHGHLVARRANYHEDNQEAPEIIYQPKTDKYYLFTSYDPLMTTYNVRVGYSDNADGPFYDFQGESLTDSIDHCPVLTAPYRFQHHPGWAGTGHCGLIDAGDGRYFMCHQGRLSPGHEMMDLHLREVFFTENGWPVVSPERYTGSEPRTFNNADLVGEWEIIRVKEPAHPRKLEAGQILGGEGGLRPGEQALSLTYMLKEDGSLVQLTDGKETTSEEWAFNSRKQLLTLRLADETIGQIIVFAGHDWENEQETVLFTGLDADGCSVWGKRVK
jgi:arabinan endo-1,5-alpha-L-arabinosidase